MCLRLPRPGISHQNTEIRLHTFINRRGALTDTVVRSWMQQTIKQIGDSLLEFGAPLRHPASQSPFGVHWLGATDRVSFLVKPQATASRARSPQTLKEPRTPFTYSYRSYVRMLIAPTTRRGTIHTATNDEWQEQFLFRFDPRFEHQFPEFFIHQDGVEECERPSDEDVGSITGLLRRSERTRNTFR